MLAERQRLTLVTITRNNVNLSHAIRKLQRSFERVGESPLDSLSKHQTVDNNLDVMRLITSKPVFALQELIDLNRLTIDASTHIPLT